MDGVKSLDPLIRCTRANDKSSRMVISPSRTQTITLHTNRRIMQPTLGFRLKISASEGRNKRGMDILIRSDVEDFVASETPESTNKEQGRYHRRRIPRIAGRPD